MSSIINTNNTSSYVASDNKAYILGDFDRKEMRDFIGNLNGLIHQMPVTPIYDISTYITSPYATEHIKNPILDIYIDSNGGDVRVLQDISTLLGIAKSRGAIIRTTVLSCAFSCGSLLAIQGTPGFRIMSNTAEHLIHFGRTSISFTSETNKDSAMIRTIFKEKQIWDLYKTHSNLPESMYKKIQKHSEGKYFNANECLEHGLCDWIINSNGIITGRGQR